MIMLLMLGSSVAKAGYVEYKIDWSPLKKDFPKLHEELTASHQKVAKGDADPARFRRHIEILDLALKKHPNWTDGLWMLSSETFQLASTYHKESEFPIAKTYLVKGKEAAQRCLKLQKNPLCELFLGSSIAKIGTIDGVFSSLAKAATVERLWLSVANSKFNFHFTPSLSMQGAVRYALGIFYRLVPDSSIISMFYDVRGNLDRSIAYHRASLALDDPNLPCSNLMLAASLLCEADGEGSKHQEGMSILKKIKLSPKVFTVNSRQCRQDSHKLLANPDLACGYSIEKQQQEGDEEALLKTTKN